MFEVGASQPCLRRQGPRTEFFVGSGIPTVENRGYRVFQIHAGQTVNVYVIDCVQLKGRAVGSLKIMVPAPSVIWTFLVVSVTPQSKLA